MRLDSSHPEDLRETQTFSVQEWVSSQFPYTRRFTNPVHSKVGGIRGSIDHLPYFVGSDVSYYRS